MTLIWLWFLRSRPLEKTLVNQLSTILKDDVTGGTRIHAGGNGQLRCEWIERFTLANPYNEVRQPENYRTP